ncbi:MAG: DNA polymerase III subunit delta' [Acidiferrobacterales bacterium]|nr:DNA polymerase III subunit delta' [Acidiferrobacterales bacterium]
MVEIPELLPWHTNAWRTFTNSLDRLAHATLLTGNQGVGKFQFASRLAMALLCDSSESKPCGSCRGCHLFAAETHPDLHVITSELMLESISPPMQAYSNRFLDDESARQKRKTVRSNILISQVRALIEQANTASHISKNKVFVIAPIDAMTDSASNSLLKVLEEPSQDNFFFLITENIQNLLPTISSRCQAFHLGDPDETQASQWLAAQGLSSEEVRSIVLARKNPLVGIRMINNDVLKKVEELDRFAISALRPGGSVDMLSLVAHAVEVGEGESLLTLQRSIVRLVKANMTRASEPMGESSEFESIAKSLDVRKVLALYDHIGKVRQELRDGSLDRTLAIEDVLLGFGNLARTG